MKMVPSRSIQYIQRLTRNNLPEFSSFRIWVELGAPWINLKVEHWWEPEPLDKQVILSMT